MKLFGGGTLCLLFRARLLLRLNLVLGAALELRLVLCLVGGLRRGCRRRFLGAVHARAVTQPGLLA